MGTTTETPFDISWSGGRLRDLVSEASERGGTMVPARMLQDRLFEIYDAVAVNEAALGVVQEHLTRTLGRTWFSPGEVEELADHVDWLVATGDAGSADVVRVGGADEG